MFFQELIHAEFNSEWRSPRSGRVRGSIIFAEQKCVKSEKLAVRFLLRKHV